MAKAHSKIKFSMNMTDQGTINATLSKGPDRMVSIEDVRDFVEKAKEYLDGFLIGCLERNSQSKQTT